MITIKPIEPQDLPGLNQLYHELMDTPPDEQQMNEQQMQKTFQYMEKNGHYYVLGAYDHDELVGSVMGIECMDLMGSCEPFMVVENVIVSERERRQGIGQKLMLEIEQIAKDRGVRTLFWCRVISVRKRIGFMRNWDLETNWFRGIANICKTRNRKKMCSSTS